MTEKDDIAKLSRMIDDTLKILKDSVNLFADYRTDVQINKGTVKDLGQLIEDVERTLPLVKEKLPKEYSRLNEVGLTGQQLASKFAIFDDLKASFYSSLDVLRKGKGAISKVLSILKRLLGVLEAILASLSAVIPQAHPAYEAKTIIDALIP